MINYIYNMIKFKVIEDYVCITANIMNNKKSCSNLNLHKFVNLNCSFYLNMKHIPGNKNAEIYKIVAIVKSQSLKRRK